jgi:hypothetical protein
MDTFPPGSLARPLLNPRCLVQILQVKDEGLICSHVKGPLASTVSVYKPEELIPEREYVRSSAELTR